MLVPPPTVIFLALCLGVQMFMSYDGGATSASVDAIKLIGNWSDIQLGALGSLDKVGTTMSSAMWGRALQVCPAKPLLVMGLGVNALCTALFGLYPHHWPMFTTKFFMGVTQGLQGVWGTCWVLLWAPPESKTAWLGLGAVAAGLGNGIGTAIAGFATAPGTSLTYGFAFKIQASILFMFWILLLLTSSGSLSLDARGPEQNGAQEPSCVELQENSAAKPKATDGVCRAASLRAASDGEMGDETSSRSAGPSHPESVSPAASSLAVSFDCPPVHGSDTAQKGAALLAGNAAEGEEADGGRVELAGWSASRHRASSRPAAAGSSPTAASPESFLSVGSTSSLEPLVRSFLVAPLANPAIPEAFDRSTSTADQLKALMRNPVYVWTALCISSTFYVISGIQYLWVRLFLTWSATKSWKTFVVVGFLVVTGIGGFIGVAAGPMIIDRCGGVETREGVKRSLKAIVRMQARSLFGAGIVLVGMLARLSSPEGTLTTLYITWSGVFVIFAATNGSLAGLTAVNACACPVDLRSFASGCTIGVQNLLGFAMGPLIPGIVMDFLTLEAPDHLQPMSEEVCPTLCGSADADWTSKCGWEECGRCAQCREDPRLLVCGMIAVLVGTLAALIAASQASAAAGRAEFLEATADEEQDMPAEHQS